MEVACLMKVMKRAHWALLSVVTSVGTIAAACGVDDGSTFGNGGLDATTDGYNPELQNPQFQDGAAETLRIEPAKATILVTGSLAAPVGNAQFKAYVGNSPTPVTPRWSLDNVAFGTIDQAGLFSASGVAGSTLVYASLGQLHGTAEVTVTAKLEENAANLSEGEKAALRAGGNADPGFRWLYPYDKTVFPRGLPAPTLQFAGNSPTAYYLHVKFNNFEYEGFFPGGTPGSAARLAVAQPWWKVVTNGAGTGNPVTVEVTKLEAGGVSGPKREVWNVAPGSLKGTVFYNSYNSALAGGSGAVLRVKPGSNAELLAHYATVKSDGTREYCVVCHSVSANGSTLVSAAGWFQTTDTEDPTGNDPIWSVAWNISTTGAAKEKFVHEEGRRLPFGALTPDGSWLVGNGHAAISAHMIRGYSHPFASRLYDMKTGEPVSDGYFGAGAHTYLSPAFSPDGKRLAFNDHDTTNEDTTTKDGHVLAMLDFNAGTNPPTSSGYTVLTTSANVAGWPSFTPDSKAVLFHDGDDFDTGGHTDEALLKERHADIKWVDVATKTVASLDALNGWELDGAGKKFYLPYGEAEDGHLNYEPTILPVGSGGYFWVVFTSRRSYGNTVYNGTPNSVRPDGDRAFDNGQDHTRGFRKKLWVAAIDINAPPGTDPSHPAFYLEGQELKAGNMRGYWALDPCKPNGNDCETGDDCCGGFCRQVTLADASSAKQCVPPPTTCSNDTERCALDADCCNVSKSVRCINQVCTYTPPK
jgi:hypothetical protein